MKISEADYPMNLIEDILDEPDVIEYGAPDRIKGLEHMISTLTEREQEAISLRYKSNGTYFDAGKKLNITRERARQIICKALRKMRHPSLMCYLTYGFDGYNELVEYKRKVAVESARESIARAQAQLDCDREKLKNSSVDIENLELSVRTYNCLRRAGYKTLIDIARIPDEQLKKIRNLGRHSYDEIQRKLTEYGFNRSDENAD